MADGHDKLQFIADKVRSSDAPTPEEPSAPRARAARPRPRFLVVSHILPRAPSKAPPAADPRPPPRVPPSSAARARPQLATAFDVTAVAAMEQLLDFQPTVSAFFEADGPKKLIFTHQPRGGARPALREVDDGNAEVPKPPSPPCVPTLSTDARTQRVRPARARTSCASARAGRIRAGGGCGVRRSQGLRARRAQDDGQPPVPPRAQGAARLGQLSGAEGAAASEEFPGNVRRFGAVLNDAATSLGATAELAKPDAHTRGAAELGAAAFKEAADDPGIAHHLDDVLLRWIETADATLSETQGGEAFFGGAAGRSRRKAPGPCRRGGPPPRRGGRRAGERRRRRRRRPSPRRHRKR